VHVMYDGHEVIYGIDGEDISFKIGSWPLDPCIKELLVLFVLLFCIGWLIDI
jgi:hypothetical protein